MTALRYITSGGLRRRRFLAGALAAGAVPWFRVFANEAPASGAACLIAWNRALLEAVRTSSGSPCLAARALAILHGAAHDAFSTQSGRGSLLPVPGGLAQPPAPPAAAMAAAAAATASALYPQRRAAFDSLLEGQLGSIPDADRGAARLSGAVWAEAHLAGRAGDGASRVVTYVPQEGPGRWRRTAPRFRPPELPQWPQLHPFTLISAGQFRSGPPPDLASPEYAAGWGRVREAGGVSSGSRTEQESMISRFWSCFSYTVTPAGHWCVILNDLAEARGLPLDKAVRAYALLALSLADASIAAWDVKYTHGFWRPIQAIPRAGEDGNPATAADPDWKPFLETPPHPEYVSGHSTFGGAGAVVMHDVFGRDDVSFEAHSDTVTTTTRRFVSFQSAADEMSASRIFGGIHFPFSTAAGQRLGTAVAKQAVSWMNQRTAS